MHKPSALEWNRIVHAKPKPSQASVAPRHAALEAF